MKDLLTYAKEALGEDLISNIRGTVSTERLLFAFHFVNNPDEYSLKDWNDAVNYVLDKKKKIEIGSRDELKSLIRRNER